jgi:ABC-type branched-subunit amino acid transport system permease subunit
MYYRAQEKRMNMSIRASLRAGLLTGGINVLMILLGLTGLVGTLVMGWFDLSSQTLGAWLLLLTVAVWGGTMAAHRAGSQSWRAAFVAGLVAGAFDGLVVGVFIGVVSSLLDSGADLRQWLVQLTPEAVELLTLGRVPPAAAVVALAAMAGVGLVGALLTEAASRYKWRGVVGDLWSAVSKLFTVPPVRNVRQYKHTQYVLYGMGLAALLAAPLVLGQRWNFALGTVGIYVVLGLGLNIVVGQAGLLDLGYVAFFAIGAYTVALLTAPQPHDIMMSFWLALIIAMLLSALAGVLLGIPVLRMRGDYLAIVTLGFGEIIRILSKSDVLTGFTGGPRGVRDVGGPSLFGYELNTEFYFMYLILVGIVLVAVITYRLQHSRVGRAWMAMREDEDVAAAVGIYTLKYKLLAFAIGAAFAGFGGAIFASRNKFTGPEDFVLMVSVNVLCLVIIGGMGSIPGVVLGALVLKGLPEVLRQLDEYRMLAFGALLVLMMIVRPEGLWPSTRRTMESYKEPDRVGEGAAKTLRGV